MPLSSVVSTTRSCFGAPTIWRAWPSSQSTKYCAGAVGAVLAALGVWRSALAWSAGLMAPVSSIAASTSFDRWSAASGLSAGL